jgi:hypothetical protein
MRDADDAERATDARARVKPLEAPELVRCASYNRAKTRPGIWRFFASGERLTKAHHAATEAKNGESSMEILLQQIINGLVLGSMYALDAWATPWCTASST